MTKHLLSIIIVEDDMHIRGCLKDLINNSNCGCIVVGESDNGKRGAALAKKVQPDLIITDISMPIMSGFEMMEELTDFSFEYLVLSGYDDFKYLKSAINFGVSDYLLKPISESELFLALEKIKKKLNHKKIEFDSKKLSYIRTHYIYELLKERSREAKSGVFLNFISSKFQNFAIVFLETTDDISNEDFKKILSEDSNGEAIQCFDAGIFVILNGAAPFDAYTVYRTFLSDYEKNLKYIGVGIADNKDNIIPALLNAFAGVDLQRLLLRQHFYDTDIFEKEVDINVLYDDFNMLYTHIDNNDGEKCLKVLNTLFYNAIIFNDYGKFKSLITKFIFHLENKYTNVFNSITHDTDANINEFIFMSDLLDYIREMIEQVISYNCQGIKKYSKTVSDAIALIHQEYKTITIETAAKKLFISSSYLMYLFKHDTNETFNSFLINYRISVACQLLLSGKKVYEVSDEIGYKSTKFFSTLFKEKTGLTPSEYVKKNN